MHGDVLSNLFAGYVMNTGEPETMRTGGSTSWWSRRKSLWKEA
jgi:hypothetical protein